MKVKIKDGIINIKIDAYNLIQELTKGEKRELAEALTWGEIMEEAARRMIGESECSGGKDKTITLNFLAKMEGHLLSGYLWSWLNNLNELSQSMTAHEHVYWKMWHDSDHSGFFQEWLERNGIESQYTSELKDHKELRDYVEKTLAKFANQSEEE